MTKEEFQELCDLSEKVFKHKYAWKKLRTQGLVSGVERVGRYGARARRMPLTYAGVKHYMEMTLQMREKMQQELEEKENESGN